MTRPRSSAKRPLDTPRETGAVLAAARRLSAEHYEVVLLLLATGIELKALSRVTWREVLPKALVWRRRRGLGDLRVPFGDAAVAAAAASFASRPRRSTDQLDRLVRASFRATGQPALAGGSPMTLRLTRCAQALQQGLAPEEAAAALSLSPALVRRLAAQEARPGRPVSAPAEEE